MPRNVGTGISEFGQMISKFGLELLKENIDEEKRVKALKAFDDLRTYLEQEVTAGRMSKEEGVETLQQAKTDFTVGLNELLGEPEFQEMTSEEIIKARPAGAAKELAETPEGAAPTVPEPEIDTTRAPTTMAEMRKPYVQQYERYQQTLASPEYKKLKEAAAAAGVDASVIINFEREVGGRITKEGERAMEAYVAEEKLKLGRGELKARVADIKRKELQEFKRMELKKKMFKFKKVNETVKNKIRALGIKAKDYYYKVIKGALKRRDVLQFGKDAIVWLNKLDSYELMQDDLKKTITEQENPFWFDVMKDIDTPKAEDIKSVQEALLKFMKAASEQIKEGKIGGGGKTGVESEGKGGETRPSEVNELLETLDAELQRLGKKPKKKKKVTPKKRRPLTDFEE